MRNVYLSGNKRILTELRCAYNLMQCTSDILPVDNCTSVFLSRFTWNSNSESVLMSGFSSSVSIAALKPVFPRAAILQAAKPVFSACVFKCLLQLP